MFEVILLEKSEKALKESFDYYESLQFGLGDYFLNQIDQAISSLENNPFFQIPYEDIGCLPVSKFPFWVHYSINDERRRVYIYNILHTSRNPPF